MHFLRGRPKLACKLLKSVFSFKEQTAITRLPLVQMVSNFRRTFLGRLLLHHPKIKEIKIFGSDPPVLPSVCHDYNNWAVRGCLDQTCPERDCGATGLSVIIFSHVANVYWVLGKKSRMLRRCCEPVVCQALTQCFEHPEMANKKRMKFNYMYMYFSPGFLRC